MINSMQMLAMTEARRVELAKGTFLIDDASPAELKAQALKMFKARNREVAEMILDRLTLNDRAAFFASDAYLDWFYDGVGRD